MLRVRHKCYGCFRLLALSGLTLLLLSGRAVDAKEDAVVEEIELPISSAELQTRMERIKGGSAAADSPQAKLLELYTQAADKLESIEQWKRKATKYQERIAKAPRQISDLQAKLGKPSPAVPEVSFSDSASLAEANQQLEQHRAALDKARAKVADLVEERTRRSDRGREIPESIAALKQQLSEWSASGPQIPKGATKETAETHRLLHLLAKPAVEAEIHALELELASYDAGSALLPLRIDKAGREITLSEKRLAAFKKLVEEQGRKQALQVLQLAREARAEAGTVVPQLRDFAVRIAEEIGRYANSLAAEQGLLDKFQRLQDQVNSTKKNTQTLERAFSDIQKRVATTGQNSAVGRLLRRQSAQLPDTRKLKRETHERLNTLAEMDLVRIELEDARLRLADLDAIVAQRLEPLRGKVEKGELRDSERIVRELLHKKKRAVDSVSGIFDDYTDLLFKLNLASDQLLAKSKQISEFIGKQVLWIRSGSPLGLDTFRDALTPVRWLVAPSSWMSSAKAVGIELKQHPLGNAALVLAVLLLGLLQPLLSRRLKSLGEMAQKPRVTGYATTLWALFITGALAAFWPLVLGLLWWQIEQSPIADDLSRSIGFGCLSAAAVLASLEGLRKVTVSDGLATAHFAWPADTTKPVRRHLIWFAPLTVFNVLVIGALYAYSDESWLESLGRLAFIVEMAAVLVYSALLFPSSAGLMENVKTLKRAVTKQFFFRSTRYLALAAPVLLIATAVMGYTYTAIQLGWRLYLSGGLLFAFIMVAEMISRGLLLARRRLAIEQARKKQEAQKAEGDARKEAEIQDELIDLATVNTQSDRLLRSSLAVALVLGLWFIWADMIPALGVLDQVKISETVVTVPFGDDGKPLAEPRLLPVSITLQDLIVALLIAFITLGAVRNLPGLLEMTLLTRLKMPAGERNAVTTILKYAITILGVVLAFNQLAIGWSKVQWLVAALGLGLAFGLQEIFANFVSGIIILFERPIRVGDVVTVGEISGTVSKIRIRATTITNFDRKELIVPNKQFVTGQVINWTRTDSVLRIIVPIGIAYGSDTEKAASVLHKLASDCDLVLKDPAPQVFFAGFGDSSLNFELRAFCDGVDDLQPARHSLHMSIERAFREADIEIACPQREARVRSIETRLPAEQPPQKAAIAPMEPLPSQKKA